MVNPQQYLDNNYANKKNTKQIKFDANNLELTTAGELVISDYPNLKKIETQGDGDIKHITKVTIINCPQLKEIDVNDFVDNRTLLITNCPQLTELYCVQNKLTQLILPEKLNNLTKLVCWDNLLTDLDFNALNEKNFWNKRVKTIKNSKIELLC